MLGYHGEYDCYGLGFKELAFWEGSRQADQQLQYSVTSAAVLWDRDTAVG